MNGNFTLIPALVAGQLGNLDNAFRHQLGDFDYGLRATAAGIPVMLWPDIANDLAHDHPVLAALLLGCDMFRIRAT